MKTIYLGKEWDGSDYTEYYFQQKKSENLLIEKHNNRKRKVFTVEKNSDGTIDTVEVYKPDLRYENISNNLLGRINRTEVLRFIRKELSAFKKDTKFYLSNSKGEKLDISEMNTVHLMNSVKKKIRDYYNDLKIEKTFTFKDFQNLLEGWTKDEEINNMVQELNKRNF